MRFVDIGVNFTHESFATDLPQVLARARDVGVNRIIVTGADEAGVSAAAQLAAAHPGQLWSTAGIHPHHARDWHADSLDQLRAASQLPVVVSLGEMGLDFFRDISPRKRQEQVFIAQLELAVELQQPVFLHERDAHDRFAGILSDYLPSLPHAVVHCFTGTAAAMDKYLAMGCYIGITGWICDERRGAHLHDCVHAIPDDKLMLETDAPYLLPRDLKPRPDTRRNEPMHLPHIAALVAQLRQQSLPELAAITTRNAEVFFNLP